MMTIAPTVTTLVQCCLLVETGGRARHSLHALREHGARDAGLNPLLAWLGLRRANPRQTIERVDLNDGWIEVSYLGPDSTIPQYVGFFRRDGRWSFGFDIAQPDLFERFGRLRSALGLEPEPSPRRRRSPQYGRPVVLSRHNAAAERVDRRHRIIELED